MVESGAGGRIAGSLLLVLGLPLLVSAQGTQGPLGVDPFDVSDGLPGMYVPDLAVTGDGRLWLHTSGRLVSFDGLQFETHDLGRFPDTDPTLRGIAAGRADTLWVIVDRALFSYVDGEASRRATSELIPRGVVQKGGSLWLWDDGGIVRVGDDGALERLVRTARGWSMGSEPRLRVEAPPNLWLHPGRPGSVRRINGRVVLDPLPFPEAWPLPDPEGTTLLTRVGDETTEVTRLDGSSVATVPRELGEVPVLLDRRGVLWVRSPGAIAAFGPDGDLLHRLSLAPGATVSSAVEDSEGNVWIGTVTNGLHRVRPLPVRTFGAAEGVTDGQVLRVSAGPDSSALAVHHEGVLTRVGDDGSETLLGPLGIEDVFGAVTDSRGTVWISYRGADGPLLVGRTRAGDEMVLEVPLSWRLIEDPTDAGVLWATGGSLHRVRPYEADGPVVEGPFLERRWGARDMLVTPEGEVWLTGREGLAHVTDDRVETVFVEDETLAAGRSIHRSSDGTIWIGHYDLGLTRYRDGEFRQVTRADGLWDEGASTILEDDHGNLWMSGNRGVHRASLAELNAFLAGEIDRIRGRGYGADAGFRNPETSGFNGYRDSAGRMWFPTFSGVARLDPDEVLAREQVPPGIRIRGVTTRSGRLEPDSMLMLPRGERRLDVAYGAVLLSGHAGVHYEVRLEGVDPDWVDVGSQRQVTYGSVPPGRHLFRVRAISGAGVPGVQEATIAFVVAPYFHETGTFTLLIVMLAGGALWLVYHLRVGQLRRREIALQGMVDDRTRDLARAQKETEGALETVEAQAAELRTLDEAKSRFFANVSHELRTPLTLVQGPLQDVLDGRLGPTPEPVREQVETVLASGRRLGELVEQLLDVAKLEAGELRLDVRRQDLAPLLERLTRAFSALARGRGITFEGELPDGAILAAVDADQMEKVWVNLLSNAMKFTPEGGRVAFTVEAGDELVVTIEDDGPGIAEEELERVFERFHQVDASSKRAHEGTGLGLALVKEVTELHGGAVEVRSELGRGSRFVVRVPADAAVELTPAAPRPEAVDELAGPESSEPRPPDADDTQRPTVLVVEDNLELRAYLRRHLEDRYRVVEAGNGREGLEAALAAVPDLILCDVMMPEMDGEELCRAVRGDPELAFLPVVMVTARASRESRLSALEGGADDYLVKPFDPEELRLRVGNLLAARRRLAERLQEEGRSLPYVSLERPGKSVDHDFAAELEAVMREGMVDEDFGVDEMAKGMSMSRSTLYRKADEALGIAPMELLWGYRLEQAAHWLRETDATVSEVAYGSGFKTVPHFTRRFKERFGETPAAWRGGAGGEG